MQSTTASHRPFDPDVGYVDYPDYRKWREGSGGFLEDYFNVAQTEVLSGLELIQQYAGKQKLEPHSQHYESITNQPILFCRSSAAEKLFTTVYEPADDRMQMDLFFDSAPTCTSNDLITAIIKKQDEEVACLLQKLQTLDLEKSQQFEKLLSCEKDLRQTEETIGWKIQLMNQSITPLAFCLFNQSVYEFLLPLWQMLSDQIVTRRFDADNPQCHLSYTASKAFEWQQVLDSINREENWQQQPILIYRYAEACFKLQRDQEGLENWFRLFLQFPSVADQQITNTSNSLLVSDWQNFNALDPELEVCFFPAWMVLKTPVLAKLRENLDCTNSGGKMLQLIADLLANSVSNINTTEIKLRASLQQLNPALFSHFMASNQ